MLIYRDFPALRGDDKAGRDYSSKKKINRRSNKPVLLSKIHSV